MEGGRQREGAGVQKGSEQGSGMDMRKLNMPTGIWSWGWQTISSMSGWVESYRAGTWDPGERASIWKEDKRCMVRSRSRGDGWVRAGLAEFRVFNSTKSRAGVSCLVWARITASLNGRMRKGDVIIRLQDDGQREETKITKRGHVHAWWPISAFKCQCSDQ